MLWIVFIAGMFVGANIGVVVACMMVSAKKRDAMVPQDNHHVEYAIMDELQDLRSKRLRIPVDSGHRFRLIPDGHSD